MQVTDLTLLKKAVIYLRVSSEEQVENFSLGTQEEICRREAQNRGYEITQIFREEGKSAKTITGRPELLNLLQYCRKNKHEVEAVIVYRLDRISRQTADYLAIRKKLFDYGISLTSATEPTGNSPTEKLVETVLAGFAQLDNDVRSERTKNGMRARFLSGLLTFKAPIGYINEGGYGLKDPESFDKVKKAWDLMATGTKSLKDVSTYLNTQNLTYRNRPCFLRPTTLQRMFRNKFYMGILISEKYPEEIRGQHVPMVTEEQFYKVQAILDGRNRTKFSVVKYNRDNEEFGLRRIMKCGDCGGVFTGAFSKGSTKRYAYYFCRNRCTSKSIRVHVLENQFKDFLQTIRPTEAGMKVFSSFMIKTYKKRTALVSKRKMIADEELRKLYGMRQQLIEKNLAGIYSDEIFKEQNNIVEGKIIEAQTAKNDEILTRYNIKELLNFTLEKLTNLGNSYESASLIQKRALISSIFASGVEYTKNQISNRGFSPLYQSILDFQKQGVSLGDPTGIRILVPRMRIWCPRPLDDGAECDYFKAFERGLQVC